MFAYVGGYTTPDRDGRGNGINVFRVQPDGRWTPVQHLAGLENPSLFTLRRDGSRLYAVHGGRNLVSAFARDPHTGHLTLLNPQDCQGNNPVDAALDPSERWLVVANYGTGTVAVLPLDATGALQPVTQVFTLPGQPGPDPEQQASSHPHAVIFDPSGRFVIVPDKGFDRTFCFHFAAGRITPTAQASIVARPGAAPRHATFHPTLPVLYVNNELDSTVTVFRWQAADGQLTEEQVSSSTPGGHPGRNTTAEIAASRCGRFLFVSNRGADTLVRYTIEPGSGRLSFADATPTGGKRPRFFTLTPGGEMLYAANQESDTITGFAVDATDGHLQPQGVVAHVGSPSAISFAPAS